MQLFVLCFSLAEVPHAGGGLAAFSFPFGSSSAAVLVCCRTGPQCAGSTITALRQTGGRHSPLSSAVGRAKHSGGSLAVQRAEAKWCCSLCVLISEHQESICVVPFLTPQQFYPTNLVFLDNCLLASIPGRGSECISCWEKTKLICASLAEEEASFTNGSSGGNAAKALRRVTQQTAALLLLSLPRMPSNQRDECSHFLICKSTLLHFVTDFLPVVFVQLLPEPWQHG